MAILNGLVVAYAKAIYLDGTKTFPQIRIEYVEPVKLHASINYSDVQIAEAWDSGYITQQEYDETVALKVIG